MNKNFIASDHAGYSLKEHLRTKYDLDDLGTDSAESCDYPIFANKLASAVLKNHATGILICGSGIGMAIAANRHNGIRAANCLTPEMARLARQHNDANVLVLGARLLSVEAAEEIVETFLSTAANTEEKYINRNRMLDQ